MVADHRMGSVVLVVADHHLMLAVLGVVDRRLDLLDQALYKY